MKNKWNMTELMSKLLTQGGKIPLSSFDFNITFNSQGVDSLDVIEIAMAFEEEYDIQIPDEKITEMETPNQFIDMVWPIYSTSVSHNDECLG